MLPVQPKRLLKLTYGALPQTAVTLPAARSVRQSFCGDARRLVKCNAVDRLLAARLALPDPWSPIRECDVVSSDPYACERVATAGRGSSRHQEASVVGSKCAWQSDSRRRVQRQVHLATFVL